MGQARILVGGILLSLGLAAAPAAAQGAGPGGPPWGAWGEPGVVVSGQPAAFGVFQGVIFGHGPVGCYFTRVRSNNRWLRAQVCDWYYGFGGP